MYWNTPKFKCKVPDMQALRELLFCDHDQMQTISGHECRLMYTEYKVALCLIVHLAWEPLYATWPGLI